MCNVHKILVKIDGYRISDRSCRYESENMNDSKL